jgi:integrase
MSLAEAREEARRWRGLLAQGKDPQVEAERARRQMRVTFGAVCEDYFLDIKRRRLRRAHETEREMRRELVSKWGSRAITDIDKADVLAIVGAILERGKPAQAHHVFSYISRLFGWALEREYGLDRSPCDRLKPSRIIGAQKPRVRVLTDAELRALWHVCPQLGYPVGPMIRLLLLTGQRRSEVAEARWSEIVDDLWMIPPDRMKMEAAHVVPLVPEMRALIDELPRRGDHLFSFNGRTPVAGFSKMKAVIDALMPAKTPHWVLHDLRRTCRSHWSAIPVSDIVKELLLAHAKQGLVRVYDQFQYEQEKKQLLQLWSERLLRIVR